MPKSTFNGDDFIIANWQSISNSTTVLSVDVGLLINVYPKLCVSELIVHADVKICP